MLKLHVRRRLKDDTSPSFVKPRGVPEADRILDTQHVLEGAQRRVRVRGPVAVGARSIPNNPLCNAMEQGRLGAFQIVCQHLSPKMATMT